MPLAADEVRVLFPSTSAVVHFNRSDITHSMILDEANRIHRGRACANVKLFEVSEKEDLVLNISAYKHLRDELPVTRETDVYLEDCDDVHISTGIVRKGSIAARKSTDTLAPDLHFCRGKGIETADNDQYYTNQPDLRVPYFEGKQKYICIDIRGFPKSLTWTGALAKHLNMRARGIVKALDTQQKSVRNLIILDPRQASSYLPEAVRRCNLMQKKKVRAMQKQIRAREIAEEIAVEERASREAESDSDEDDIGEIWPQNRKRSAEEMEADEADREIFEQEMNLRQEIWEKVTALGVLNTPLRITTDEMLDTAVGIALKQGKERVVALRKRLAGS